MRLVVEQVWILVLGSARSWQLAPGGCFSSGWIFQPLDDPHRLFFNNDAGSSGIAENMTKFFRSIMQIVFCIFNLGTSVLALVFSGFRKSCLPRCPLWVERSWLMARMLISSPLCYVRCYLPAPLER